ncbi:MAG: L-threonylcarbamoyladenylate synthase [Flavobacteriales bacterium]
MAEITEDISAAVKTLQAGQLVAIPTETVYGLAANALSEQAVMQIFEAKHRPTFDPLIVHIGRMEDVDRFALEIPDAARTLMTNAWPGPLTILLKKNPCIPDLVTSGLDTVGLRMPHHALTLHLLQQLEFPLAAPSANPFGYISPTTARHVQAQLGEAIPLILDGGPCEVGVESTIIDCSPGQPMIHRLGGLSREDIERWVGPVQLNIHANENPVAPGMLTSHYAPRKPMLVGNMEELLKLHQHKRVAILSFTTSYDGYPHVRLSANGDLREAARNLFASMRVLDAMDGDVILAEWVPDEGLGMAINDRLKRASTTARSAH